MKSSISLFEAVLPLIVMLVLMWLGAQFMELSTTLLVPVMLFSAGVAGYVAKKKGHGFEDIQKATGKKFAAVMPALLILLAIGMLIGSWMLGGTIPVMIYYGLDLVNPRYLLVTAFLVTSVMSLATGTSWASAGTIGVVLMGMAEVVGVSTAACAGAVLSGAYFGDKISPLSDSTNICAIGAKADLYDHIRNMLYTALPSFVIAVIVYTIAGFAFHTQTGSNAAAAELISQVETAFRVSGLALLPVLVVIVGIVSKAPPVLAMTASSVIALILGIILHGFSAESALGAMVNGFHTDMLATAGLDPANFGAAFSKLVNRGGLYSMINNFLVIISAFLLAAALDVSGALTKIVESMLAGARSTFGLIAAAMSSGVVMIGLTSHGGVTALVVGDLFQGAFRERNLAPENLSRSMEDSVTIVEPLMPWTVSAIYMSSTLQVSTFDYLPWAVFCYGGSFFSLLYAATFDRTGFGLTRLKREGTLT